MYSSRLKSFCVPTRSHPGNAQSTQLISVHISNALAGRFPQKIAQLIELPNGRAQST